MRYLLNESELAEFHNLLARLKETAKDAGWSVKEHLIRDKDCRCPLEHLAGGPAYATVDAIYALKLPPLTVAAMIAVADNAIYGYESPVGRQYAALRALLEAALDLVKEA